MTQSLRKRLATPFVGLVLASGLGIGVVLENVFWPEPPGSAFHRERADFHADLARQFRDASEQARSRGNPIEAESLRTRAFRLDRQGDVYRDAARRRFRWPEWHGWQRRSG